MATVTFSAGPHLYRGSTQHKGMAMVPKQALVVMSCEIARLLQLTKNSIVPISYVVQRKVLLIWYIWLVLSLSKDLQYLYSQISVRVFTVQSIKHSGFTVCVQNSVTLICAELGSLL